jgi:hypothetical protein
MHGHARSWKRYKKDQKGKEKIRAIIILRLDSEWNKYIL